MRNADSREQQHRIRSADGTALNALVSLPGRAARAALILCHGITTNCDEHGAFPALRRRALDGGLAVVRFDFRAHGRSGGAKAEIRMSGMRLDVEAVMALVAEELGPHLPIVPLGVSFGGAAAVHAAWLGPACAGLVLWYAVTDYEWNYGPSSLVPFTRAMRAAADPQRDPGWSEMPILGSDYHFPREMVREFAEDRTTQQLADLRVPILAYHGSRDTFVPADRLRQLSRVRPNLDLRIAVGAGHGFLCWRRWVISRTAAWAIGAADHYAVSPPSTTTT